MNLKKEKKRKKHIHFLPGLPGGSVVKNLLAKQEVWIPSWGGDDLLEKKMATHSSILAWETS